MEIKNIYNTLSGGKSILGDDFIISSKHFNSISRDRFIIELKKKGIIWDGNDITYIDLINTKIGGTINNISNPDVNPTKSISNTLGSSNELNLGIDIQEIEELPDCFDYWEDEFYNTKFTKEEIAYCLSKDNVKQSFSGIYSCKEALIKLDRNIKWDELNISYDSDGKPRFENYSISISHSGSYSVAVAIKSELVSGISNSMGIEVIETDQLDKKIANNLETGNYPQSFKILKFSVLAIFIYLFIKDFIGFENIKIFLQNICKYP